MIQKIMTNVTTGWKSTVLGIIIVLASIASIFIFPQYITWWPQGTIAILVGCLLIFSPDTLITSAIQIIKQFAGIKTDDKVAEKIVQIPTDQPKPKQTEQPPANEPEV